LVFKCKEYFIYQPGTLTAHSHYNFFKYLMIFVDFVYYFDFSLCYA